MPLCQGVEERGEFAEGFAIVYTAGGFDAGVERGDGFGREVVVSQSLGFVVIGVTVVGVGGEAAIKVLARLWNVTEFGVFLRDAVVGEGIVGLGDEDFQKFDEAGSVQGCLLRV